MADVLLQRRRRLVLNCLLIMSFEPYLLSRFDFHRSPCPAANSDREYGADSDRPENVVQLINQFQKCT
jgi:hypothetical protein